MSSIVLVNSSIFVYSRTTLARSTIPVKPSSNFCVSCFSCSSSFNFYSPTTRQYNQDHKLKRPLVLTALPTFHVNAHMENTSFAEGCACSCGINQQTDCLCWTGKRRPLQRHLQSPRLLGTLPVLCPVSSLYLVEALSLSIGSVHHHEIVPPAPSL